MEAKGLATGGSGRRGGRRRRREGPCEGEALRRPRCDVRQERGQSCDQVRQGLVAKRSCDVPGKVVGRVQVAELARLGAGQETPLGQGAACLGEPLEMAVGSSSAESQGGAVQ